MKILTLDYKSCVGIEPIDKLCHLDKSAINPATGQAYAVNPATGNWDDTYFSTVVEPAYKQANPNMADLAAEQNRLRMEAIKPAIESYQASKPEVTSAFESRTGQLAAEKQPLIDRYQTLLDELTGRETKETAAQGKYMSQEWGKRGVPLSSGMYQEALTNKTQDISQYYGTQQKETTLSRESDLRDLENQITNLTSEKVEALRGIDQAIANLQADAGNQSVTDALTMYRDDLNRKFESRFDELDKQLKEKELAKTNTSDYSTLEFNKNLYAFNPSDKSITELLKGQTGNATKKYTVVGGS